MEAVHLSRIIRSLKQHHMPDHGLRLCQLLVSGQLRQAIKLVSYRISKPLGKVLFPCHWSCSPTKTEQQRAKQRNAVVNEGSPCENMLTHEAQS